MKQLRITPISAKAEEGTWVDYRGVDLLIARANNSRFKAAFRRITRPYKEQIDRDTLSPDQSEDLFVKAMAEGLLLNWKNFMIEGEEIPYSKENAVALLKNDEDCVTFVNKVANDINNYLIETEEETTEKL